MNKACAGVGWGKLEGFKNRCKALERSRSDIRDCQAGRVDFKIQRIGLESATVALWAGLVTAVAREQHPNVHFIDLALEPLKISINSIPITRVPRLA